MKLHRIITNPKTKAIKTQLQTVINELEFRTVSTKQSNKNKLNKTHP